MILAKKTGLGNFFDTESVLPIMLWHRAIYFPSQHLPRTRSPSGCLPCLMHYCGKSSRPLFSPYSRRPLYKDSSSWLAWPHTGGNSFLLEGIPRKKRDHAKELIAVS